MEEPTDVILAARVERIEKMKLKGVETIKECSDELTKWDPRIVSSAVKSRSDFRDFIAADQQQQQQQQQAK